MHLVVAVAFAAGYHYYLSCCFILKAPNPATTQQHIGCNKFRRRATPSAAAGCSAAGSSIVRRRRSDAAGEAGNLGGDSAGSQDGSSAQ